MEDRRKHSGSVLSSALLCALISIWAITLQAGELRRCRLANGGIHYSDAACPPGSKEVWVRDLGAANTPLSEEARARMQDARAWQRENRSEVAAWVKRQQTVRSTGRRGTTIDRCDRARKQRDRIRDREFMTMTFDRAVELDDRVREQCR